MCLILLAHGVHPRFPVILAANRDEFFSRPTDPAHFWPEHPHVLAGRDLEQGGTWLGIARDGRWAAVTNFRDGTRPTPGKRSRGELVAGYLRTVTSGTQYVASLGARAEEYHGFNLFVGDCTGVTYVSNRTDFSGALAPGVYGLSNGLLDDPWPKVEQGKVRLLEALSGDLAQGVETLFDLLSDRAIAADQMLPRTGVSLEWERTLSAAFISAPEYGTRSSTVMLIGSDNSVHFTERTFDVKGGPANERRFDFRAATVIA
jgi:uncharacterized protein with NRDE domain